MRALTTWSRRLILAVAAIAVLVSIACGSDSPTAPDGFDVPALQITEVTVGTGATTVAYGSTVTVHYEGWVYDPAAAQNRGLKFDDTRATSLPATFTLVNQSIIPGWIQGMTGMKIGGRRILLIPSVLAYGRSGKNSIPPNSAIIFDIELLDAR